MGELKNVFFHKCHLFFLQQFTYKLIIFSCANIFKIIFRFSYILFISFLIHLTNMELSLLTIFVFMKAKPLDGDFNTLTKSSTRI